jgi:D-alanyl-D-alanine carboxypeptidase (penicillin-binding protein 5/6)
LLRPSSLAAIAGALLVILATGQSSWAAMPIPKAPEVPARSYYLMDPNSGRVLAENHADDRVYPASLTKLMTAYVVFSALKEGRLKLTDQVTISEHAWRAEGSRTFLQVGTQVPADILLKGMIVQSGNDAAIALAERVGGTEEGFAQMMNFYAIKLGLKNTHYVNAAGLPDPNHYTTAHDLATLATALIRDFPEHYPLFSLHEFIWNNIKQQNRNELLGRDPSVDGLKTGHTDDAGYCLVASANRNGMRLISVLMGAPSDKAREDASATLLGYGYAFFETTKVKSAHEIVLKPRVFKAPPGEVAQLTIPSDIYVTVARGEAAKLQVTTHLNKDPLIAPVPANTPVGDLIVTDPSGQVLRKVPLIPAKAVPAGGLWTQAVDGIALWFH